MAHFNLSRSLGLLLLLSLFAIVGCSENSPLSSVDRNANDSPTLANTELYGRVATIDPAARTMTLVNDATPILIDAGAEVVFKDGGTETPIDLSEINPGDSAEVRGVMSGGTLMADRLRIRGDDNNNGNELEIGGRVAAVDPVARTISLRNNALIITVLPTAEVVQKNGGVELPIELGDISAGDSVDIRGTLQTDGSLAADRVRLRVSRENFAADLEFKSTVTEIDYANGTFMVAGRSELITTDASTFIFVKVDGDRSGNGSSLRRGDDDDSESDDDRLNMPIEFTDIAVGDTVEVYANVVDASTLYAVVIELEDGAMEHALEVEFKDILASVDMGTGTVTFVNSSWVGTIVAGADLAGLNNEPLFIDAFSAGETVEIKGFKTGENTIDIVRMHKDNTL